jgi:uncharacterized protein YggE
MIFHKLPRKVHKFALFAVLAAAVSLFAISASAGSHGHQAKKDNIATATGNGVRPA